MKHTMTTLCNSAIIWLSFLRANTVIKKVERDLLLRLEVKRLKFCSMVSFFFFTEKYEEDIEQLLMDKVDNTEQEVCYKLTKACEGVDRSKKEKESLDYRFNNQPQQVKTESASKDDDGIHRMNVDINDPGAAERLAEQIKSQLGQQGMGGGTGDDDDDDEEEEEEEEGGDNEDEENGGAEEENDKKSFEVKTEL